MSFKMELKKYWKLMIGIGILLLIPPAIYIVNFHRSSLSEDPAVWGLLGDYIGGVLNPFISLLNVIVLGWLTYIVSEQSSAENKRLFILEKRMDAYGDLVKHVTEINSMSERVKNVAVSYVKITAAFEGSNIKDTEPVERFDRVYRELSHALGAYSDFYYTLFTFNVKYSHLFDYNFDCEEFKELIRQIGEIRKKCESFLESLLNLNIEGFDETNLDSKTFDLMARVFNEIRKEVLIKQKMVNE
jgi:hypothetical protein